MTIQQIECFLEVARLNSFSQAAAALYMSQPTLSRHIQGLERELNVTLFIRANNTVRLSQIGQALQDKLAETRMLYQKCTSDVFDIINENTNQLRIGMQIGENIHPKLRSALKQLHKEEPKLQISFVDLEIGEVVPTLISGKIDLLFGLDSSIPSTDLFEQLTLEQERLCLAVPADHPNACLNWILRSEIDRYFPEIPLLILDVKEFPPPLHAELQGVFQHAEDGEELDCNFFYATTLSSIYRMVELGFNVTITNENSLIRGIDGIRVIPFAIGTKQHPVPQYVNKIAVWKANHEKRALARLIQLLRSEFKPQDLEISNVESPLRR